MCVAQALALVVDTVCTYMLQFVKAENKFTIELFSYDIFELLLCTFYLTNTSSSIDKENK